MLVVGSNQGSDMLSHSSRTERADHHESRSPVELEQQRGGHKVKLAR